MNNSRIIGNNIAIELKSQSIGVASFADSIGYSLHEAHKLMEGRLFLPPMQLKKIADVLSISLERLLEHRGASEYNALIHNFRDFKNQENQELVLDLIDMYADLEEAL